MNHKTAKLFKKAFGAGTDLVVTLFNSLSIKEKKVVVERLKLFNKTKDKASLLKDQILSDIKLEA